MKKWTLVAAMVLALTASVFVLSPAPDAEATSCFLKMASGLVCDTDCSSDNLCFDYSPGNCCGDDVLGDCVPSNDCTVCLGPGCTSADF